MERDFLFKYVISLFNEKTCVTTRQLKLIATAKRTPSVLFNVEKNKLYALFGLFPEMTEKKWEKLSMFLVSNDLLALQDEHLVLTEKGIKSKTAFSDQFPVINHLNQLSYYGTLPLFFNRMIFVTQVLSEYSFRNKNYSPFLSSVNEQRKLKQWLIEQKLPMNSLTSNWAAELKAMLKTLPTEEADFISAHFTGYDVYGETSRQLQERYGFSKEEYRVRLQQFNYKITLLEPTQYPLLSALLKDTHKECHEGLSHSANITKQLLEKGKGIDDVARMRKLKVNTIREHILECVLILNWPYFKRYISREKYAACRALLNKKPKLQYAEAKNVVEDLDFFVFRLVEIERTRRNGQIIEKSGI
ncbi:helix-turn-helix domain-containing protein [Alkalibacterium kapii]|nr:helix-turn-helix domain-containing protein [Alkalibacterium kapii]